VFPGPYEKIKQIADAFDYVLTFDHRLIAIGGQYRFAHLGGCWIREPQIHEKTKGISIIASKKKTTSGQQLRQTILQDVAGVDRFGTGTLAISDKADGLRDYRYSIAVENCQHEYYFTEKIIDCFATGTIPIYWGPKIVDHMFNSAGIIHFDTIDELRDVLTDLDTHGEDRYHGCKGAIRDNFETAKMYANVEDALWEDHLRRIVSRA
jgi:hypothetical protein